jgi:DNA-binding response OmpR family regulator
MNAGMTAARVLVADDNIDAAESLAMLLDLEGYEVRVAHDGEQALEVFNSFRPDVALLDLGMPRLTGYEVVRAIRQQAGGSEPFLIALTGWGQDSDKRKTLEAGFDYHAVKPVDVDELCKLIKLGRTGPTGSLYGDAARPA